MHAKNRGKRRWLGGPEPRHTANGSKNRKPGSKREKWPTTTKRSLRPLRDGLRDLSLPSGRENRENRAWFANRGKAQKSPEVRRQGSQLGLRNLRTSTICNITKRSIGDIWILRSVKNGLSTDRFTILLLPIFKLYAISFLMRLCFLLFRGSHHRPPPLPNPLLSKLLNMYCSLSLFWIIFLKKNQIRVVNFVNIKIKIIIFNINFL